MVVSSHRESHIRLQHSKFVQELDAMFLLPLVVHLWKLMEPKNEGLENDFPLQRAVFEVPCEFSGE